MTNLTQSDTYYAIGRSARDGEAAIVECQKTVNGWTTKAIVGGKSGLGNAYVSDETVDELCNWLRHDFSGKYQFTDSLENAQAAFHAVDGSRSSRAAAHA